MRPYFFLNQYVGGLKARQDLNYAQDMNKIFSENGRIGAEKRHAPNKILKDFVIKKYLEGNCRIFV